MSSNVVDLGDKLETPEKAAQKIRARQEQIFIDYDLFEKMVQEYAAHDSEFLNALHHLSTFDSDSTMTVDECIREMSYLRILALNLKDSLHKVAQKVAEEGSLQT